MTMKQEIYLLHAEGANTLLTSYQTQSTPSTEDIGLGRTRCCVLWTYLWQQLKVRELGKACN